MSKFKNYFSSHYLAKQLAKEFKVDEAFALQGTLTLFEANTNGKLKKLMEGPRYFQRHLDDDEHAYWGKMNKPSIDAEKARATRTGTPYSQSNVDFGKSLTKTRDVHTVAIDAIAELLGYNYNDINSAEFRKFAKDFDPQSLDINAIKAKIKEKGGQVLPDPVFKIGAAERRLRAIRQKLATNQPLSQEEQLIANEWQKLTKFHAGKGVQIIGNNIQQTGKEVPQGYNDPNTLIGKLGQSQKPTPKWFKPQGITPDEYKDSLPFNQAKKNKNESVINENIDINPADLLAPDEWLIARLDKLLSKHNMSVVSDEEAENEYLASVVDKVLGGQLHFRNLDPNSIDDSDGKQRAKSTNASLDKRPTTVAMGIEAPSTKIFNPGSQPGLFQTMHGYSQQYKAGKTAGEPYELPDSVYGDDEKVVPKMYYPIPEKDRSFYPDEEINQMYRDNQDAFQAEIMAPARAAVSSIDPNHQDDALSFVIEKMWQATGAKGWRDAPGLRRWYANKMVDRFNAELSKRNKERSFGGGTEDDVNPVDNTTGRVASQERMTQKERDAIRQQAKQSLQYDPQIDNELDADDALTFKKSFEILQKAINRRSSVNPEDAREALRDLLSLGSKSPAVAELLDKLNLASTSQGTGSADDDDDF